MRPTRRGWLGALLGLLGGLLGGKGAAGARAAAADNGGAAHADGSPGGPDRRPEPAAGRGLTGERWVSTYDSRGVLLWTVHYKDGRVVSDSAPELE